MESRASICIACGAVEVPFCKREFHNFPEDPEWRKTWLLSIDRPDLINKNILSIEKICSDHFHNEFRHIEKYARPAISSENEEIICIVCGDVKLENGTPFYAFPRHPRGRTKWLLQINMQDLIGQSIPSHNSVCYRHFPPKMFSKISKRLVRNAYPIIAENKCKIMEYKKILPKPIIIQDESKLRNMGRLRVRPLSQLTQLDNCPKQRSTKNSSSPKKKDVDIISIESDAIPSNVPGYSTPPAPIDVPVSPSTSVPVSHSSNYVNHSNMLLLLPTPQPNNSNIQPITNLNAVIPTFHQQQTAEQNKMQFSNSSTLFPVMQSNVQNMNAVIAPNTYQVQTANLHVLRVGSHQMFLPISNLNINIAGKMDTDALTKVLENTTNSEKKENNSLTEQNQLSDNVTSKKAISKKGISKSITKETKNSDKETLVNNFSLRSSRSSKANSKQNTRAGKFWADDYILKSNTTKTAIDVTDKSVSYSKKENNPFENKYKSMLTVSESQIKILAKRLREEQIKSMQRSREFWLKVSKELNLNVSRPLVKSPKLWNTWLNKYQQYIKTKKHEGRRLTLIEKTFVQFDPFNCKPFINLPDLLNDENEDDNSQEFDEESEEEGDYLEQMSVSPFKNTFSGNVEIEEDVDTQQQNSESQNIIESADLEQFEIEPTISNRLKYPRNNKKDLQKENETNTSLAPIMPLKENDIEEEMCKSPATLKPTNTRLTTSEEQQIIYLEFMKDNQDIGRFGKNVNNLHLFEKLAKALNKEGPLIKTALGWKKYFCRSKRKKILLKFKRKRRSEK